MSLQEGIESFEEKSGKNWKKRGRRVEKFLMKNLINLFLSTRKKQQKRKKEQQQQQLKTIISHNNNNNKNNNNNLKQCSARAQDALL